MPDITERIAEVLRRNGVALPFANADYRRYETKLHDLAADLVEELGLTQQWGSSVITSDSDAPVPYFGPLNTRTLAECEAAELDGGSVVSRFVTRWEADD